MAKKCWCTLAFHLPGEWKRHQRAAKKAAEMQKILDEISKRGKS